MPRMPLASPLVSVALPVLNGADHLPLAVQSILDQTFTNWELLLIDDGSTDNSLSTLPQPLDQRIHVVRHSANRGLVACLNEAIDLARGPLFARMDHDDFAHPERLKRQVDFLESHPEVDLLGTKCVYLGEGDTVFGEMPYAITHEEICLQPWRGFYLAHPTWMGRIEWFRRYRYVQPKGYRIEDQQLLLRAHADSRFHTLPETLLAYRIPDRVPFSKLLNARLALFGVQNRYFADNGELGNRFRAGLVLLMRIALDISLMGSSPAWAHARRKTGAVSSGQKNEWAELIRSARQKVHRG